MTQDQEKKLLEAIYDRLFDAITYQPEGDTGGKTSFDGKETFIHFSKNAAVDAKSFANPRTPSNPLGDLKTSEEFSRMVDQVSPLSMEWQNSSDQLSQVYKGIVDGGNANTPEPAGKNKLMYDKAYDYLHHTVTEKNPFTDEEITELMDSKDYVAFKKNRKNYEKAVSNYRVQYNNYLDDLTSKDEAISSRADRKWQAVAPLLENTIADAYTTLIAGNSKYVKQALNILETTINDGVRQALVRAKEAVGPGRQMTSSLGRAGKWLMSYPTPANWTEEGALSFSDLKISGSNTEIRSKSTSHKFSADTSVNYGLWKVKADASGEFKNSNSSTDSDSISISAKIAKVDINRPWFMESLFRLKNWSTNMGNVSTGEINSSNKGLIPMYPVAFIVARDIVIEADFSHEDEQHMSKSVEAGGSVGYGPFSIGGSYGYGSSEDNFNSDIQEGAIKVPGIQIIGWVSRVMPKFGVAVTEEVPA